MTNNGPHSAPVEKNARSEALAVPRMLNNAPFVALDGSETVRHENALAVERTERGYRVDLAVVDPGAIPLFSELFQSKFSSREAWDELRRASYGGSSDARSHLGFIDQQPTPSLVASIELSGPELAVSSCRLSLTHDVQVSQRCFGDLPPLMPPKVPESNVDVSLVAAAQLGLALYTQRRQRGDVVFADVKHGLLLQPDGSWELFNPHDLLGRITTQEITCKVLEGVAMLASSHNIPLIYQGCSEAEPTLSRRLGEQLRAGVIKSRDDVDRHLVDIHAHRTRLLNRREYSSTPIPHAGLHLSAYLRMSAPLREFVDCVNLQQLVRFSLGEPPHYGEDEIKGLIAETSQRQHERIRRKGDQKYSSLVHEGVSVLRQHGSMSPTELRSFVTDCRDGGKLPGELLEYLLRRMESDPTPVAPILSSLLFSRFIGDSRELRRAAQWIVANRPELIEQLIQHAIEGDSLSMQVSSAIRVEQGGLAESVWCVDGRVYTSQRFVEGPRPFDDALELVRVQRIQFAKLCGTRYGWESPHTGNSELFPNISRLLFELHLRGTPRALGYHVQKSTGEGLDCTLSVSANLRLPEATLYQAKKKDVSWLRAIEGAALEILDQLAVEPSVGNQTVSRE